MTTNFFQLLAELKIEADWQIVIKTTNQNAMLVTVLLANGNLKDDAKKLIPPMVLKGTVADLGAGFFTAIANPARQTAALFVNLQEYQQAQAAAQNKLKTEQAKKQPAKTDKSAEEKKYDALMRKIDNLQAEGKYREAYGQLPKAEDYPGFEEQIKAKKEELIEQFDNDGLFAQAS